MTDRRFARAENRALKRFALGLVASLLLAQPAFAQDEPSPAATSDIEHEAPPGDPPRAAKVVVEEKPAEGSIKDASEKRRPMALSLGMYVPWLSGVGIGFKLGFEIPIMHNGFLKNVNDSFSLEPRFMLSYQRWNSFSAFDDLHVMAYTPALAALWSFYFKTNLRAYAFVALGYTIADNVDYDDRRVVGLENYFYHDVGVGGYYNITEHWAAFAELGYAGMRLGISFLM